MRNFLSHLHPKHWKKPEDAATPHQNLVEIESQLKRKKRDPEVELQKTFSWDELSYTKLDHSHRQIRRLKLEALYSDENTSNDRYIECTLATISLDSKNLKYDALSYVWGDADVNKSHPICINGGWTLITQNLWLALRTLYHQDSLKDGYIWIDAVCINQQDNQERSEQVSMMLDIFRHASLVHIMLTVAEDLEPDVQYLSGKHPFEIVRLINAAAMTENLYEMEQDIVDDLTNFILRPWWKRLWVVQECIAAQKTLAYLGKQKMPFDHITQAIERIISASYAHEGARKTQTRLLWTSLTVESIVFGKIQDFDSPSLQVLSRFHTTNMKQSSNPRDRIYAQLGYLPASIAIRPDYTLTVGDVYRTTTIKLMQWDNSLFPLYLVDHNRKPYPSWVPDYENIFAYQHNGNTDACPGLPACFEELTEQQLLVHALIVDTVQAYAYESQKQREGNDEFFEATRAAVRECLDTARSAVGPEIDSDVTMRKRFWRTLCGGTVEILNPDRSISKCDSENFDASMLEKWLSGESTSRQFAGMLHNVNRISATVNARSFFVTAEKRFGTTYAFVAEGDVVALLAGSRLPMLLRPCGSDARCSYQLVGPCYGDGIMEGEALADIVSTDTTDTALDYGFEEIVLV